MVTDGWTQERGEEASEDRESNELLATPSFRDPQNTRPHKGAHFRRKRDKALIQQEEDHRKHR